MPSELKLVKIAQGTASQSNSPLFAGLRLALGNLRKRLRKSTKFRFFVSALNAILEEDPKTQKIMFSKIQRVGVFGVCCFFFSMFLGSIVIPTFKKFETKRLTALKPGKFRREVVWNKFPFLIEFSLYMFNVTNPDEIKNGEKPILQEVGPFVYDKQHEKTNQVDRDADDTVEFTMRDTLHFNLEKSNGLTGDEEVIVPHYFILGVLNVLMLKKPTAIPLFGKAMDSILKKPTNIFIKVKVKHILFEGLTIDCTGKDFASVAVCSEVKPIYKDLGMSLIEEDKYSMSLLASRNATDSKTLRVYRGIKKIKNVGKVIEYDHKPNMSTWDDEFCDTFYGTDGTVFHTLFDEKGKDIPIIFSGEICRNIYLKYVSYTKFRNLDLLRYTGNLGVDVMNNPLHKCYCKPPENCLKRGLYDATKCMNMPLIISNPHFYLADPYYLSLVEGINPIKENHMIIVDFDVLTGVPMYSHKRAQFNMKMFKVEKWKVMKNFPDAVLPLFWIDEKIIISEFLIKKIVTGNLMVKVGETIYYILMFGGLGICGFAGYKQYKIVNKSSEKKPEKPKKGKGKGKGKEPLKNSNSKTNDNQKKLPISTIQISQVPAAVG